MEAIVEETTEVKEVNAQQIAAPHAEEANVDAEQAHTAEASPEPVEAGNADLSAAKKKPVRTNNMQSHRKPYHMRNTPMREGLMDLSRKMHKEQAAKKRGKSDKKGKRGKKATGDMIRLNTRFIPAELNVDNLNDYININDTSLNKNASAAFTLVTGKVISIQRAIDQAIFPKMRDDLLMVPKLSVEHVQRRGKQCDTLPNYWALIGYIVIERIRQDKKLLKTLVADERPIVNVAVNTVTGFKGSVTSVAPITTDPMYTGVVREVVKAYRETKDVTPEERAEALEKVIHDLKANKDLSIYAGTHLKSDDL